LEGSNWVAKDIVFFLYKETWPHIISNHGCFFSTKTLIQRRII